MCWTTTLDHCAKRRLGINEAQYSVADLIYHLSSNPRSPEAGWCTAKRAKMASMLSISVATLYRALAKLKQLGVVEGDGDKLRTTAKWWEQTVGYKEPVEPAPKDSPKGSPKSDKTDKDAEIAALKAEIEALKAAVGGQTQREGKGQKTPKRSKESDEVVEHLNQTCGTRFKSNSKATTAKINTLATQGFTVDDMKMVIEYKHQKWGKDPKMREYLRPETLFGSKFESYLNAAIAAQKTPIEATAKKEKNRSNMDFETVMKWASEI